MKVGLIIYGSINTMTGGYIYDYMLVEYLRSQGVAVKIFSQKQTNFFGIIGNNFSQKLLQEVIEFSPDILLEDEMNFPSLVLFNKRLKKIEKFPIISIVHLLQANMQKNFIIHTAMKHIERMYLKSVDGYIFNSYSTQKSIVELIGKKNNSLVAHPGKDRLQFEVFKDRIPLKCQDKQFKILFIGNLLHNKGLHVLLQALAQIDSNGWQLSIVGDLHFDLNYTKKILEMIESLRFKENITIYGALDRKRLKKELLSHHVLIVPSYYESFGIVYAEAMGAGLPIIAGNKGGVQEIVDHAANGFLIPPGNSFILSHWISQLIQDRELLTKMSFSSLSAYKNMSSWNESMARVYTFLNQLT